MPEVIGQMIAYVIGQMIAYMGDNFFLVISAALARGGGSNTTERTDLNHCSHRKKSSQTIAVNAPVQASNSNSSH